MTQTDHLREKILAFVRHYYITCHLAWTKSRNADDPASMTLATAMTAEAESKLATQLVGLLTPPVDPNEDTQLIETIKESPIEVKTRDRAFQRLFDELLVRQERVYEVIVHYLGGDPKQIRVRTADLFNTVVDLSRLLRAYGGDCKDLVDAVEKDEANRRANTKAQARSTENEARPVMSSVVAALSKRVADVVATSPISAEAKEPETEQTRRLVGYPAQLVEGGLQPPVGYPAQAVESDMQPIPIPIARMVATPSVDAAAPAATITEPPQG